MNDTSQTPCSVSVWRICEHCNKEYLVPLHTLHTVSKQESVHNFGDCPNCGKRDDVWIRLEVKPNNSISS